jgi:hypothetical protein
MWRNGPFVAFFSIVVLVAIGAMAIGWRTMRLHDHLLRTGILSKADVVEYYIRPGIKGGQNHYFLYRYSDERNNVHEGLTIRNRAEERLRVGDVIPIVYDAQSADQHVPFLITKDGVFQPLRAALIFSMSIIGITWLSGKIIFWVIRQSNKRSSHTASLL